MKTGAAEQWVQQQLTDVYDADERHAVANLLLEHITGLKRLDRLKHQEQLLAPEQLNSLTGIIQRLQQHEPVQYVLGEAWFFGMPLYVNASVLIPRPETEELVQWIIDDVKASGKNVLDNHVTTADKTRSLKILDVGTGSGCIALALKKKIPKAEVWGCDKSESALTVARRNGATLDVRVDFHAVDILDDVQWHALPQFDIIVSNPPYITPAEAQTMPRNVTNFEPHLALFTPQENPLLFYETLAKLGSKKLHAGGNLFVEIHEDRGAEVVSLFENAGYSNVQLRNDLQAKNRMVTAEKVGSTHWSSMSF